LDGLQSAATAGSVASASSAAAVAVNTMEEFIDLACIVDLPHDVWGHARRNASAGQWCSDHALSTRVVLYMEARLKHRRPTPALESANIRHLTAKVRA
jgi:hypothetical protein